MDCAALRMGREFGRSRRRHPGGVRVPDLRAAHDRRTVPVAGGPVGNEPAGDNFLGLADVLCFAADFDSGKAWYGYWHSGAGVTALSRVGLLGPVELFFRCAHD